jgi:hypothetical protein
MKKVQITILFLFQLYFLSYAQIEKKIIISPRLNLIADYAKVEISQQNIIAMSNIAFFQSSFVQPSYGVGINIDYQFSNAWELRSGLIFNTHKYGINLTELGNPSTIPNPTTPRFSYKERYEIRNGSIEIPFLLVKNMGKHEKGISLQAGVSLCYFFSSGYKYSFSVVAPNQLVEGQTAVNTNYNQISLGLRAGIAHRFSILESNIFELGIIYEINPIEVNDFNIQSNLTVSAAKLSYAAVFKPIHLNCWTFYLAYRVGVFSLRK